ncbi:incF plasmid conjugative transfer pilus assembly protein traK [Vibrio sp. JCM 19236]|nr:incF plasmid conjugative transfer pilus assembly protein traK [Vibrio sp. JCM 19236]
MNIKYLIVTVAFVACFASATDLAVIPSQSNSGHGNNSTNALGSTATTGSSNGVASSSDGTQKQSPVYVISSKHVNRIVTPFKNPSVKLDAVEGVATKSVGNVLYISTSSTQPIAGFITESGDESAAIKVILRPLSVAPQEIVLKGNSVEGSELARRFERSSPRSETIKSVMADLVRGDLPAGYQMKQVNAQYLPHCEQSGLTFNFYNGQFVSGGDYVVSIGVAENRSTQAVNFTENNCFKDGVVAVSAYPTTHLLPNEKTEVFVMFYRVKPTATQHKSRRSLIGG